MPDPVYEADDTDACRVAVANLEFCLACCRYDLSQCSAPADAVERCCKRFWVRAWARSNVALLDSYTFSWREVLASASAYWSVWQALRWPPC